MKGYLVTTLISLMLISGVAYGAIINVPGDQSTIQAGIDAASDGDTVLVADGTYTGDGNKNLDFGGKAITVTSTNGASSTVIDCENNGRGFYFHSGETSSSVISGFTITNGFATILPNNNGGGIFCDGASPRIIHNIIVGNEAVYGGGICSIKSSLHIIDNTIAWNKATGYGGGGIYCGAASPMVLNTILWANSPDQIYLKGGSIGIAYSDVEGGKSHIAGPGEVKWGEGNISATPLFVNRDKGDYRLRAESPCINAGDPNYSRDLDGTMADMGAGVPPAPIDLEMVTCTDVEVEKNKPIGVTDVFTPADERSCVYMEFNNVPSNTGYQVHIVWYNPDGRIYDIFNIDVPEHPNSDRYYWYWAFIGIKGQRAADMPGEWTVVLRILTLVKREPVATDYRQINFFMKEKEEIPSASPPGFVEKNSYAGDCRSRPAGTVCIEYSDGYIWLVDDSVIGWDERGSWQGKNIQVALGQRADFYHILGTRFVKQVPKSGTDEPSAVDWPMFQRDAANTGYTSEEIIPPLELRWEYKTDKLTLGSPVVADGVLYIGSLRSGLAGSGPTKVYAIDTRTGKAKWISTEVAGDITTSPAVAHGLVYVTARDGYLYALDVETGKLKWKRFVGVREGYSPSSPVVWKDILCVGASKGVYVFDALTGKEKWRREVGEVRSSPAIAYGFIYVGASSGLHVFYLDGKLRWKSVVDQVWSSPVVADGVVYAYAREKTLYAFDATDGRGLWKFAGGLAAMGSPAVAHGTVYAGYRESLYALDADSGTVRWEHPALAMYSTPAVVGTPYNGAGELVFLCVAGAGVSPAVAVQAFDTRTGALKWQSPEGLGRIASPTLAISDGCVYVAVDKYSIYAFSSAPSPSYENMFFISLEPGLNMISLPLKPISPYTARNLAEKIDATVIIKLDEVRKRFVGFTIDDPGDGFPIEGGKGYIVNVEEEKTVKFEGSAWTNQPPIEAAPPIAARDSVWAFVVNVTTQDARCRIQVENKSAGASLMTVSDRSSRYSGVWADMTRQAVIHVNDVLEVTVINESGVIGKLPYAVTARDIGKAFVTIPLDARALHPITTMLYQNYPNPFNPETWIPYQLQESAEVAIRIYDAKGGLVRNLDLGQRAAGFYQSRTRAAYWDGRNDSGELIASGIYFYQLRAGEFSATRRMLIVK